ncbi:hypothetical protein [Streptomyces sp. NPDC047130]|uniref:cucumopine synthase-related protein n=1 Tax=Streptomyces sp. NPDC047130 TaxID=3155261 RepID=UPI00340A524A
MRRVKLTWPSLDLSVTARLDDARNPALADTWWRMLPYRSIQSHAVVADGHMYHLAPDINAVFAERRTLEDRTHAPDGSVYLTRLQHLLVKYAPVLEPTVCARVAQVEDADVPALATVARRCWEAVYRGPGYFEVEVAREGHPSGTGLGLPPSHDAEQPAVRDLIGDLRLATERIWLTPAPEVVDLHGGRVPLGSRGQYFSTLVYVNGEMRTLGSTTLNPLARAAHDPHTDLAGLLALTRPLTELQAEFLGHCGFRALRSLFDRVYAVLPQVRSKADYGALIAELALHVNCLRRWNLHFFPWHHGDEHRWTDAPPARDRQAGGR